MAWNLDEALDDYRAQGAPQDQMMLTALLKEIGEECGALSGKSLAEVAAAYGVKESLLLALAKRIPGLRLDTRHCLEICGGPSCTKKARLLAFVEKTYGRQPKQFELKIGNCMRLCGKGPNIRWDGKLYSAADEALIRRLTEGKQ